ncbi:hypothetical protein BASA62_004478 [Batrachochytrium salamandrivorans]|nr:hypothetical protein BASA62_004478 [Batrachochytrium salamandrivorans]
MAKPSNLTRRTSAGNLAANGPLLDDVDSFEMTDTGNTKGHSLANNQESEEEGKTDLSKDFGNMVLLVFLYMLQGVPLGLSMGSVPFLLKSKLGYSDLALFSLSSYPYSMKLLWSPIVDSTFIRSIGRRKSWIVPIQAILGLSLLVLGSHIDAVMAQVHPCVHSMIIFISVVNQVFKIRMPILFDQLGDTLGMHDMKDKLPVGMLALVFTTMVFLCATQDIAVDGWALTLLHEENKTYASTAQTIGLNTGYFLSFTVFLAFNSPELCNKYLRFEPLPYGFIQLGGYLQFWGVMFLICNAWLTFFKKEASDFTDVDDIKEVYHTMARIVMLPHMKTFIAVLLLSKIGFIANDAVTGLKLLENGFSKEDLALAVLIDFPFQIIFGYYAAKWSSGSRPLKPWLWAFYGRLIAALLAMTIVYFAPQTGVTTSFFVIVMVGTVFSSFMSTLQFIGMGSFFTKISDPTIGGTYMTLLNTLSNLGGTWPKYFVLKAVDYYTDAPCNVTDTAGAMIKCTDDPAKDLCKSLNGTCDYRSDGYYIVNIGCMVLGLVTLFLFIKPSIAHLEKLPERVWRVVKEKIEEVQDTSALL